MQQLTASTFEGVRYGQAPASTVSQLHALEATAMMYTSIPLQQGASNMACRRSPAYSSKEPMQRAGMPHTGADAGCVVPAEHLAK